MQPTDRQPDTTHSAYDR